MFSAILIYRHQLHALSTVIFLQKINEVFLSYCPDPDTPEHTNSVMCLQLFLNWTEFDTDS